MGEVEMSLYVRVEMREVFVGIFKVPYAQGETIGHFLDRLKQDDGIVHLSAYLTVTGFFRLRASDWRASFNRDALVTSDKWMLIAKPSNPCPERRVRRRIEEQVEMLLSIDGRYFATISKPAPVNETTWGEFLETLRESSDISRHFRLTCLKFMPYLNSVCIERCVFPGTFVLNFSLPEEAREPRTPEIAPEFRAFSGPAHRLS
jgi:hypothetical protein